MLLAAFGCLASDQGTTKTFSIKMKSSIAIFMVSFVILAVARPNEEKYTDRYDNLDLDEILNNDKIFEAYVDCLLDKGKCTPEGKELKGKMADALENGCAKCTDPQKLGTRRVISHLINHKVGYWDELCAKYDPKKKYAQMYEKELREVQSQTV